MNRSALALALLLVACSEAGDEGARWEPCVGDEDCKDGRLCQDGACVFEQGTQVRDPETQLPILVFRLALAPSASGPIYVQANDETRNHAWLRLFKGSGQNEGTIVPEQPCHLCYCEACDRCNYCGPANPAVGAVAAGEAVEFAWDGTQFPADSTCANGAGTCYRINALPFGSYGAEFCWSLSATGVGAGHQLGDPIFCERLPFAVEDTDGPVLVEYRVTEGA